MERPPAGIIAPLPQRRKHPNRKRPNRTCHRNQIRSQWNSQKVLNRKPSKHAGIPTGKAPVISRPDSTPSKPAYCIMLPPPNVTGTLHMGHAFKHTLMDALTRYHRMQGDNTLWQPGTDHAGIATQIVVERQLDAQGITRHDLGREKFLERSGSGRKNPAPPSPARCAASAPRCDWSRERFTMDEGLSKAVTEVFVRLYERRPDLSRQAAGELGSGAGHRGVRSGSGVAGRRRLHVAHPLSAGRRRRRI